MPIFTEVFTDVYHADVQYHLGYFGCELIGKMFYLTFYDYVKNPSRGLDKSKQR